MMGKTLGRVFLIQEKGAALVLWIITGLAPGSTVLFAIEN